MATIGPNNPLQPNPFAGATGASPAGIGSAGNLGFTAGAPGLNYGGQVMSEVDILVALIKLLQQGQTAPTGTGTGTAASNPALKTAAGKPMANAAPGKPAPGGPGAAGGMALKRAPAKVA